MPAMTYLETVTKSIRSVFGARLTGVWLLGSGAYGGFGPTSDLDLQAATEHRPTPDEVATLVRLLRPRLAACPAEGLEFVLYDRAVLADPRPPLRWSLNLNGGPKRAYEASTDPDTEAWHWFVLDLAIGRHSAVTLAGSDLADVLGPIAHDLQVKAIAESVRWHADHEPDEAKALGNAVRALRFLNTGEWGSKPDGLAWLAGTGMTVAEAQASLRTRLGETATRCRPDRDK